MRRRDFITLLGGAAVAWPLGARAQQSERHVVVLMLQSEDDPDSRALSTAFAQSHMQRGSTSGGNVRVDLRWAIDNPDKVKAAIAELQVHPPDVIVASTSQTVAALLRAMPMVPLVFTMIYEPVAQGFVQSLAHPGGNATGFTAMEATIGGGLGNGAGARPCRLHVQPEQSRPATVLCCRGEAARDHAVAVELAAVHGAADIETVMMTLGREPGGGLIVPPDGFLANHGKLIIELAARNRLPRSTASGYLLRRAAWFPMASSYRSNSAKPLCMLIASCRRKPANLPVQEPTEYALVINLKTAKTLGLDIPPTVLAVADDVIE